MISNSHSSSLTSGPGTSSRLGDGILILGTRSFNILKSGMSFTEVTNKKSNTMKIEKVWFDSANIYIVTDTGHIIGNPLSWYKRLMNATPEQRLKFELGPHKDTIHWEELDEDILVEALLF